MTTMEEVRAGGRPGIFEERALEPGAPSMSSIPRCIISSPSAEVHGTELHSLTPSTACSLVVGTVVGSVARLCAGSLILAGNGSPSSMGSGWCSAPWGDGGLGSLSGMDLSTP